MNPFPLSNGRQPFEIKASEAVREAIQEYRRAAILEGRGAQFVSALKRITERLQSNPSSFGEELFQLPAMRLKIRCAIVLPIYVDFAVSEDRRVVYLRIVKLLDRS